MATSVGRSPLARRRIAVTGGAGFIGSHAVDALVGAGAAVLIVDDLSTGKTQNLAGHASSVALHVCDIRSREARDVTLAFRPHVVVHLAAQASVSDAVRDPLTDSDVNVCGTVNMLEAAAAAGTEKVVLVSSSAVYGRVETAALPIDEQHHPVRPTTSYGISKAAALSYAEWFARHRNLAATALIPANVYGPRQPPDTGVVARFASAALAGRAALIRGDGSQTRDFVHVFDVAEVIVRACVLPAAGRVNVATGVETTINQLHRLISEMIGTARPTHRDEPCPGEVHRMSLAIHRAGEILGWKPRIALPEGLGSLVEKRAAGA